MEVTNANWKNLLIDQGRTLDFKDRIVFNFNGQSLAYHVATNHLCGDNCCNDRIFSELYLPKYTYCAKVYGYDVPDGSVWPSFHDNDYTAATKIVIALFKEIEAKEQPKCLEPEMKHNVSITVESIQSIKIIL